jgi:hypothetical protein
MTARWASESLAGTGDDFATLHSGLTINLISTPANALTICTQHETVSDVLGRNSEGFDFIPVVDENQRFVGMFHAAGAQGNGLSLGTIWQRYFPLSEDYLIGADASILDFLRDADTSPCRLVISGAKIVGLVSLSDLQRLPVRAALFALITGFEITMTNFIKQKCPKDEDWLHLLAATRRQKIEEEKIKSNSENSFVDAILFTQFCDKREILIGHIPDDRKESVEETLYRIEKLRNSVAHANEYASSPTQARKVWQCGSGATKPQERTAISRRGLTKFTRNLIRRIIWNRYKGSCT